MKRLLCSAAFLTMTAFASAQEGIRIVGHRGLIHHAPENTLATFAACLELRLGFELDIQRTKDEHLVCIHDVDVARTTTGKGKVADFTLAELRKLDAGRWFDDAFAGERVPTLEEIFALITDRKLRRLLIALDFKIEGAEAEVVQLLKKHGLLGQVVCIGLTISDTEVRRKLRAADAKSAVAVLAQTEKDLDAALAEDGAWLYVRFIPTAEQARRVHAAGKRLFLAGPTVMGHEVDNWRQAAQSGVDAVLTDYPLECRAALRPVAP